MSAYLINHQNNFKCNICAEIIPEKKVIGLKCNVKKHIFCYDCINDWYNMTRKNYYQNSNANYTLIRMCPICRKNGGYLPNLNNHFIKEIHYSKSLENITQTCSYKLKNKNEYCMNLGQSCYNHLCKKHHNVELKKNSQITKEITKISNEEINKISNEEIN